MIVGAGHGEREYREQRGAIPPSLKPISTTPHNETKKWGILSSIGSVASNIGAISYQYIPGVKAVSGFIAGHAIGQLVPKTGVLQKEITERKNWLDAATGSPSCRELCRVLAEYGTQYLQHHLCNGTDIDASLRNFLTNNLLYDQTSPKAHYGFYGDLLQTIVKKNPQVLAEILEANILKAFCNIGKQLQNLQENQPHFLVDFTKELLVEYTASLQKIEADEQANNEQLDPAVHLHNKNQELFVKIMSQSLLKLALPNGVNDLEFPISGKTYITDTLFELTATVVLPKVVNYLYEQSTSNYVRDLFVLKTFQGAHQLMSMGIPSFAAPIPNEGEGEGRAQIVPPAYSQQEAFNHILAKFGTEFLRFLDPTLLDLASFINIEQLLTTNGTVITQMLQRIELLPRLGDIVQLLLPLINTGKWRGEAAALRFESMPFTFSTHEEEERQAALLIQQKQAAVQIEIRELMDTMASDFTGIGAIGAERVVGKFTKEQIAEVMSHGSFFEQCKLCAHLFLINIVTHIFKFICLLLGQKKVKTISEQLYIKISSTSIPQVTKPFESMLAHNMTIAAGL